jgi:integrase/recombinase XerD
MNSSVATIPQALSVATSTRWTDFSKYFHRSPERLGPSHIREYQVHLFRDRKLSPGTIQSRCAALRFLFVKTLRRPYLLDEIPFPKRPRKLPTVLSPEEVRG